MGGRHLDELLGRDALRSRAGDRVFARGARYADEGRVELLDANDAAVSGVVAGTGDYQVRLWVADDDLNGACDCPMGEEGQFCKHQVALALARRDRSADAASPPAAKTPAPRDRPSPITMDDLRAHLEGLDHATLVEIILAQADRDDRLRERLQLDVAMGRSAGASAALVRRAIDQAIRTRDFVPYAEAWDYARGIHDSVDLVERILRDGSAAEAVDLCEHALRRVERVMGEVDDSDGEMGGLLGRIRELHIEACRAARVDPVVLASRLFAWELGDDRDVFSGAALTYADVLGPGGLAEYRRLAEAEWAKVPQLEPGADSGRSFAGRRFRVTSMMMALARAAGDVDELVAVMSRDLASPYAFLEIAALSLESGRDDQAIIWAERGVQAFPDTLDGRLLVFLADLYHRGSRDEDAVALVWEAFARHPTVEGFRLLRSHAERAGTWPSLRSRAFDAAGDRIARAKAEAPPPRFRWERPVDGSDLVRMHLLDGDVEAAWQVATALGCAESVWLELAARRESDHPADAIPVYQREVEVLLGTMRNEGYAAATERLVHIRELMARLGSDSAFPPYLAAVRAAHARKRNFTKALDATRW